MTGPAAPRISVLVPAFNGLPDIEACLRSVRESSFPNYELIVVDDGSHDDTAKVAARYADLVIEHETNLGRHATRCEGFRAAKGEIVAQLDQDVLIPPDALDRIEHHLAAHQDVVAVTTLLSPRHPDADFLSEYKNLYMHYVFRNLDADVDFLYGSLFAVRREAFGHYELEEADFEPHDTGWGQRIAAEGGRIVLLKDLEVVHLKKFSLRSFVRNDFLIPYQWAHIFVAFRGWRGLRRRKTGFAHASWRQLGAIALSYGILLAAVCAIFWSAALVALAVIAVAWLLVNARFFRFLEREKGFAYASGGAALTFLDNLVMGAGIACGLARALLRAGR
jgi:glycosyltransferase involved in cell wall biosynthesis